jgi:O-succinylbenzoate synthase
MQRYRLVPRQPKNRARDGALIRVEWAHGQTGFSDLHPWPEFGEPALDEHLKSLADLKFTPLAEKSMEFNYQDREYRLVKRNAFLGLILPRAHRLVFDVEDLEENQLREWVREGFTHVKVKMGRNLPSETEAFVRLALSVPVMWRVDFNGRIQEAEFLKWWSGLDAKIKARIDFVEDPLEQGELKIDGPWANDWKRQPRARIRVVKPAREPVEDFAGFQRVVFTHSLDHPIGQACSAWAAARYYMQHPKRTEVCGLAATDFFQPDDFSKAWRNGGPRMKPTDGTGFGFDELLHGLQWERLL